MGVPDYIEDLKAWREEFEYFYPVTVRFSETDAFGHLNNTTAFVYFEHGRISFFKQIGLMQDWTKKEIEAIPVTADLHCDYVKQVYFDEELQIGLKLNRVGRSSMDIHYMAVNGSGEICFTGRGAIVQVSSKTGQSIPWTIEEKERLESRMPRR